MTAEELYRQSERAEVMHDEIDAVVARGWMTADEVQADVRRGTFGSMLRHLLAMYPTRQAVADFQKTYLDDAVFELRERSLEQKAREATVPTQMRALTRELEGVRQARLELRRKTVNVANVAAPLPVETPPARVVNAELWGDPATAPRGGAAA